jgi:hypothetical protein
MHQASRIGINPGAVGIQKNDRGGIGEDAASTTPLLPSVFIRVREPNKREIDSMWFGRPGNARRAGWRQVTAAALANDIPAPALTPASMDME